MSLMTTVRRWFGRIGDLAPRSERPLVLGSTSLIDGSAFLPDGADGTTYLVPAIPTFQSFLVFLRCEMDAAAVEPLALTWLNGHATQAGRIEDIKRARTEVKVVARERALIADPTELIPLPRSRQESVRYRRATHVVVVRASAGEDPWTAMIAARSLADAISHALSGVVYDPETSRLRVLDPARIGGERSVASFVDVFAVRQDDGLLRLSTRGLTRLGVAELELEGVKDSQHELGKRIVLSVAERLVKDAASPGEDGAPIRVRLGHRVIHAEHFSSGAQPSKVDFAVALSVRSPADSQREEWFIRIAPPVGTMEKWLAEKQRALMPEVSTPSPAVS
jgi:hypothetical protein